ncbi:hypothetical protein PENSPDRAFT_755962 [Peniophora sp. CONT]|nr:hypothetical protein PENSPDRAFT_755962 [Peniophora sp. CONT]
MSTRGGLSSRSHSAFIHLRKDLDELHVEAWGRRWQACQTRRLCRTDVDGSPQTANDAQSSEWTHHDHIEELEYECIEGMGRMANALCAQPSLGAQAIVVLGEYKTLLVHLIETESASQKKQRPVVVTGHPGIGKTTFLFYLLLYRLERKHPTAIQLDTGYYFIFDDQGVVVRRCTHYDHRLDKCWALVDSNSEIVKPCGPLSRRAARVIQTTPPEPERWSWYEQYGAALYVMDLPNAMEVAAIIKEHNYDPSHTLFYVSKWGPSPRTILRIVEEIDKVGTAALVEDVLEESATHAAQKICATPSILLSCVLSVWVCQDPLMSNLLFITPRRRQRTPNQTGAELLRYQGVPMIPTKHLFDIFTSRWLATITATSSLQLYNVLGSDPLAQSLLPAGWMHAIRTHARLTTGSPLLRIFQGKTEAWLQPSTHLLRGALGVLENADTKSSFYWYPSSSDKNLLDFDGILGIPGVKTGLLARRKRGDIYAIVHAISNHENDGCVVSVTEMAEKLWDHTRHLVTKGYKLNVLVVADEAAVAQRLVTKFTKDLKNFRVGRKLVRVGVGVWGCVLNTGDP